MSTKEGYHRSRYAKSSSSLYIIYSLDALTNCSWRDIRLVDGSSDSEGRVEYCSADNIWRAIADDQWDYNDAKVACKQLNLPYECEWSDDQTTVHTTRRWAET